MISTPARLSSTDYNSQVFLASEGLFKLGLYITKASVLLTVERVLGPDQKAQRLICWVLQGVQGLCGLGSLLAVLVKCNGASLLTAQRNDQCPAQVGDCSFFKPYRRD